MLENGLDMRYIIIRLWLR